MEQIHLGFFDIKNPYTKAVRRFELSKEKVHSIVFWSKNYNKFLNSHAGDTLKKLGFNLYFNFTINSESKLLEGRLPPLKDRLNQLSHLSELFGAAAISWRFDPICFYQTIDNGPLKNNLDDFQIIAKKAGKLGIKKCVTSFCDLYAKILRRNKHLFQVEGAAPIFSDPSKEKKIRIIRRMEAHLKKESIHLFLCCEKKIFGQLGFESTVQENACIDGSEIKRLFGGTPEIKRDYGQRSKQGCRCSRSIDIGSYEDHPCHHNCLFCYANPQIDNQMKQSQIK